MEYLQALQNPAVLHAMAVHFPVALAVLGVPVALAALIARTRKTPLWLTVLLYVVVTAAAFAAATTGEGAREHAPGTLPKEVWNLIDAHEELGEKIWIAALATALVALLAFIPYPNFSVAMRVLAVAGSLTVLGMVSLTAHRGGTLVYEHGVGTAAVAAVPDAAHTTPEQPAQPPAPQPAVESPAPALADAPSAPTYENDIRPIFAAHCTECHSEPDATSGLNLTTLEGARKGGKKNGQVIIGGNPDGSPMVQHLEGKRLPQMPRNAPPLAPEKITAIRSWIAAGAQ